MIKIFSQDKTIYLTDDQTIIEQNAGGIFSGISSQEEMYLVYNELITKSNINTVYLFNENLNTIFNYFSSMFRIVEAAGGLVKNKNNEWLFIYRNDKWDLPKGKIEKDESIEAAAIREVEEECGISELTITKKITTTYHTYFIGEKSVLKPTHWFEMLSNHTSKLIPQIEEGITDVQWLNKNDFKKVLDNTYESVKDVMKSIS